MRGLTDGERARIDAASGGVGIAGVIPNPNSGINNTTFIVRLEDGRQLLFRRPGEGTELFTSRAQECAAYEALQGTGLTDELICYDVERGEKLTVFLPGCRTCDVSSEADVTAALAAVRRLHESGVELPGRDDPAARLARYKAIAAGLGQRRCDGADWRALECAFEGFGYRPAQRCPIHGDCLAGNLLMLPDGSVRLIDLEFAAMGDPICDIADLCHDACMTPDESLSVLERYLGRRLTAEDERHYRATGIVIALMWSAWADCKVGSEPDSRAFYEEYREMGLRYALSLTKGV